MRSSACWSAIRGKRRDVTVPEGLILADPAALLAREPSVLIEAISDASTSLALIRPALARRIDLVSANKQGSAPICPPSRACSIPPASAAARR